jgi:glycosyltransferase involved in cell wall biosynthesis
MAQPTVSVVMPTFNRLQFLPSTVESIFRQTMQDWELIVADDGSDQQVLDYLHTLEGDQRVRVLRLARSGNPGTARNAAIAVARTPLVAFVDSDDLWEPSKLERQLALLRAKPECRWSYTAFSVVDAEGMLLASERSRPWTSHSGQIFAQTVRSAASIRTPSVVASTELLREVGAFDEAIDCSEDYDLWIRLALRSPVCLVDEPLVRVRRHAENLKREVSAPYLARDYSLCKLARCVTGAQRALLEKERSRNALALAAKTAAYGGRWRALGVVAKSLPFSWKYPSWWYRCARALARACFAPSRKRSRSNAAERP